MKLIQRNYPKNYFKEVIVDYFEKNSYPFYLKECGYLNERKMTVGNENNFSDFLFLYIVEGVLRFSKNKSTQYLHPEHMIVSACNTPIVVTKTSKTSKYFYIIIGGSHAKKHYNLIRTSSSVLRANVLSPLQDYFIEIMNLDFDDKEDIFLKGGLLIHNILYESYRISTDISKARRITPAQETIVNQAIDFIKKNYQGDLSIDAICSEISFSKYYFCRLFKKQTGVSIHEYVNEFRVNKSKELLTYSKLSVSAIAISVGFKTQLTFSRAFERSMHMTPSEYRRNF